MSLTYIILWLLFQLFVEINCQMTPFKRSQHTATLIDNKLYILGGVDDGDYTYYTGTDFFYLDVSVAFNTKKLSWQDLSSINTVPSHTNAASVKGGANNNTLFLYGGAQTGETMALVYTFDPQSNSWSIPKIVGYNTVRKSRLTGVIDYNGKMYLWGGYGNGNFRNDMIILDTINLSWGIGSLVGAPTPRENYGAVLLPNNNIIYIGGWNSNIELSSNQIYIYDTTNDNWSMKTTLGKIPSNRDGFSAVLGLDGKKVIIFGGAVVTFDNLAPGDSLYVLNLNNFEWYIPKISGQIPNSRMFHEANVIGKYMVISLGYGYSRSVESDILLLDISNNDEYIWTYDFDPTINLPSTSLPSTSTTLKPSTTLAKSTTSPYPPQTQIADNKSTNNKSAMIGAIIGSLFGGILLSFGIFFLYKWNKNKKKQKNLIPTSGNGNYNNNNGELMLITTERNMYNYREKELPIPNESTTNHELITDSVINKNYNHEQETAVNKKSSIQNTDDSLENSKIIHNHGQEMSPKDNHGQEIIQIPKNEDTSNNELITDSVNKNNNLKAIPTDSNNERFSIQDIDNVLEKFKNEMLQVVRQEIMQNLRQEPVQNNEQAPNSNITKNNQ